MVFLSCLSLFLFLSPSLSPFLLPSVLPSPSLPSSLHLPFYLSLSQTGPHRRKIILGHKKMKGIVIMARTVANEIHHGPGS